MGLMGHLGLMGLLRKGTVEPRLLPLCQRASVPACLCERFSFRIRISRAFIRSARRIKKILRKELVDVVDFLSLRQVAEFPESEELEESLGGDVESIAARFTLRIDG